MKVQQPTSRLWHLRQKLRKLQTRLQRAQHLGHWSRQHQQWLQRLQRYQCQLRRLGYATALSLPLLASPLDASAQSACADGSEFQINTYTTGFQTKPSMAADSDGNFVVVWRSNGQDGSGYGIYGQRYDNMGATAGSEFLVNSYTTGSQNHPAVAMDNDGDFVVVWQSYGQDGSDDGIYAQRYDNTGATVGSEFLVNTYTTNYQEFPSVAMDSDGDFVVVWQSFGQDGNNWGIYGQRYNSSGMAQGSEFQVNSYTTNKQHHPTVAMDSDGDFVVAWQSYEQAGGYGTYHDVYAQRYNSSGMAQGSEFQVNTHTTNNQHRPTVAMDSDGDFVIAWSGNYDVFAQRYNSSGTAQGSEFLVNSYTTYSQNLPTVAMDSDGDFVIAWSGNGLGDYEGVYAQRYNSSGTAQGSEFLVNTHTTDYQTAPSVAMDSDGDFIIAWESGAYYGVGQDGDYYGIFAQRYSITCPAVPSASGSEFQVNTYTTDDQRFPSVAIDSDGDFVVVWESYTQDGHFGGIYAQRYDNMGAAAGSEFLVNTYTTSEQKTPSVAIDNDGDFVVVWQSNGQDGNSWGVYAQRYDNMGAAVGSEFLVNTYTTSYQQNSSVAIDSDGDFVVVWDSNFQDGSSSGIYAQRYDKMGATVGSEFLVNTYTTGGQSTPSIAIDDDGNFVIAWQSNGQDGHGSGIYAQRYDNTGTAVGSEFLVNTYTTNNQGIPSVAIDSDGDFVIAWQSNGQDGYGGGIYAQRYDNTGAAVGSEFQVNTYTSDYQQNPSVAIDSDGDFVVAWHSYNQNGYYSFGIYAQQYDKTGVTVGSEFQVNTYTTGWQRYPSVAIDSDGDFVVAWESNVQDANYDYGIYAQRYDSFVSPPSISCGPTSALPTAAGTYTGAVATADADGFTYYCDADGNLLLAIKPPAGGWVIPADAVQLKIGATPVDFYPKFCGATGADRCFVRNNNGAPIVNRYWEIDESKITIGSAAGFVEVKHFFTNAEFLAVNTELTAQGVATLPTVTDMNLYNVNGHQVTTPFPAVADIKPFQVGIVLKNGATPRPSQWVHSTHGTSDHIATFQIYPTMLNSGGGLGGKLKNN